MHVALHDGRTFMRCDPVLTTKSTDALLLPCAVQDEATAALDPASEAAAYALVRSACMSFVSVGHRPQLLEWHTHVLANSGCGAWQLYTAAAWRQRLAAGQQA